MPERGQPHPRLGLEKPYPVASLVGYLRLRVVRKPALLRQLALLAGLARRFCLKMTLMPGVGFCFKEINPCLENHGGCHKQAECVHTGPNQVSSASGGEGSLDQAEGRGLRGRLGQE